MINVSDIALQKLEQILSSKPEAIGIKIALKTKGCSGLKWGMELSYESHPSEEVLKLNDNVTLFIDPKAVLFAIGMTVDYMTSELESGFSFISQSEKGRCGCGESFFV